MDTKLMQDFENFLAKQELFTVKWYNDAKGYGFLVKQGDPENRDIFVHYTAIKGEGFRTLVEGQQVEAVIIESPKGPQASEVFKRNDLPILGTEDDSLLCPCEICER